MTAKEKLCTDCNSVATNKALVIWAYGAQPELSYFCDWHFTDWKAGA